MWATIISAISGIALTAVQAVQAKRASEAQAEAQAAADRQAAADEQAAADQAAAASAEQLDTIRRIAGTVGPVLAAYGGYKIGQQIRGKK